MYKNKITDIYDAGLKMFYGNQLLNRFDFLVPYLRDLDDLMEFKHGRQLLDKFVDNDRDYIISKVHRGVYVSILSNSEKYKKLIAIDELNYNPLDEFDVLKQYGVDKTTNAFAQDKTTNAFGQDKNTMQAGAVSTTNTTAPRTDTNSNYTTAFDTTNEKLTEKTINTTVQTVDTTATGSHTDTNTRDARTDTSTRDARTDTSTRDARQDNESGHRTNAMDLIAKERAVASFLTLETIVDDTLNFLTYSLYV